MKLGVLILSVVVATASGFSSSQHVQSSSSLQQRTLLKMSTDASAILANDASTATSKSNLFSYQEQKRIEPAMGKLKATLTKAGMMAFIASMCLTLPVALLPQYLLYKAGLVTKIQKECMALKAGQFSARWLLRLIPFCNVQVTPSIDQNPQPSIWVCNHVSALDIFIMLATDKKLRGRKRRPIKIVYWKQLEDNPITKLLFQQCGFIPVNMAANKAGEANDYDMQSFKSLLKESKQAFQEGFDIGILPEGQLNPSPETGLLPCFGGAFTLARMSKRPIQMMALHGTHRLWHAREDIGMTVTGRQVKIRAYGQGRKYKSAQEFLDTFQAIVGEFGTYGQDMAPDQLQAWLDGSQWQELQQKEEEQVKQQQ